MLELKKAERLDNESLLSLVKRTPQSGLVTLNFEREPNYFHGSEISTQDPIIMTVVDNTSKETVGLYSNGSREVYVNGKRVKARYANDLRIDHRHRGKNIVPRLVTDSQKYMDGNEYSQMVILKENVASLKSVANRQLDKGEFFPYGRLTTYVTSTGYDFSYGSDIAVRQAMECDIPSMQRLYDEEASKKQFYPVYDFSKVGNHPYYRGLDISDYFLAFQGEELVGILGKWKQNKFKQTRIVAYPAWLKVLRPIYNVWTVLAGGFWLPDQNSLVRYTNLHTAITKSNDPKILTALLSNIRKHLAKEGERTMVIGFTDQDPLRSALKKFVSKKMHSFHFVGTFNEDGIEAVDRSMPLYIEVARL